MYSVRSSHGASLTSQASAAALNAKLAEKMKEFDALRALEKLGTEYVRRLEALDMDCNVMADAGKGIYTSIGTLPPYLLCRSSGRSFFSMAGDVSDTKPFKYAEN